LKSLSPSPVQRGTNPKGREPIRDPKRKHRINNEIRVSEVRLIDQRGDMIGIVPIADALSRADHADLDLVEIAPTAKPPVCRIIDYGKFIYELQKKEKLQKKNQQQSQLKEVRFKWRTDTHDFNFKTRHARNFLEDGDKVKASVFFRGREITHQEIGRVLLERFLIDLADVAKIDAPIKMEGRSMVVILSPSKSKKKVEEKKAEDLLSV